MEYENPFTLHLFARNADKHRGSETERLILTLHHPSSPFIFLLFSDSGLNDRSLAHASIKTSIRFLLRSCYGFCEACFEAQISFGRAFFNFCNFWTC